MTIMSICCNQPLEILEDLFVCSQCYRLHEVKYIKGKLIRKLLDKKIPEKWLEQEV